MGVAPARLAVFCSGGGSNLQAIIDGIEQKQIHACITVVLTDRPCGAQARARRQGIAEQCIDKKQLGAGFCAAMLQAVRQSGADYVILAGYLSIIDAAMVQAYPNRIVNIHPALIPSFCGMGYWGHHVHEAVVASGVKISGATVHFVDETADTGPIIAQAAVPVYPEDTPQDVADRVLEQEHILLPQVVAALCEDRIRVCGRTVFIQPPCGHAVRIVPAQ